MITPEEKENLRYTIRLGLLETIQFSHSNGNHIVIEPTAATERMLALIDSYSREARLDELERLWAATNEKTIADKDMDYEKLAFLYGDIIRDRIAELKALGGKENGSS